MEEQQKKPRPAGDRPRPARKKPADGAVKSKTGSRPSGEPVRKKRRPAEGAAAAGTKDASAVRKKKRPAGERPAGERSTAKKSAADAAVRKRRPKPDAAKRSAAAKAAQKPAAMHDIDNSVQKQTNDKIAKVRAKMQAAGSKTAAAAKNIAKRGAESGLRMGKDAAGKFTDMVVIDRYRLIVFGIFMFIYVIVLAMIIGSMNRKANDYLTEYEESRPQYQIEAYVNQIDDDLLPQMVAQSAAGMVLSAYETPDMLLDAIPGAGGTGKYSYQKTPSFTENRPNYYILRNGEAIATVSMTRTGWTEKYTFPLWKVDDPVSAISLSATPAYTVSVTVPQGSSVKVNGVEVPADLFADAPSELQLTPTELAFMPQPVSQCFEISGLYKAPEVTATDAEGRVLTPETTPNPAAPRQEYVFPHAAEEAPDQMLVDRITALTYAYMDYTINTRCDIDNNLAILNNYLLPGSDLAVLMQQIYSDIWYNNAPDMREDHVFEVRNVRMYSKNLCTADVHLESTIGKVAVNDYVGTVRWVLVNNGFGWYASDFELFPQ